MGLSLLSDTLPMMYMHLIVNTSADTKTKCRIFSLRVHKESTQAAVVR